MVGTVAPITFGPHRVTHGRKSTPSFRATLARGRAVGSGGKVTGAFKELSPVRLGDKGGADADLPADETSSR
jgi:hypothetical protein